MAIYMSDGAIFRRHDPDAKTGPISVVEANPNFKAHKDDTAAVERPKSKPKASRSQAKKKAEEMNAYVLYSPLQRCQANV